MTKSTQKEVHSKEWLTINEMCKDTGIPMRTMREHANKMVDKGLWEYRFRKERFHNTREFRRKS